MDFFERGEVSPYAAMAHGHTPLPPQRGQRFLALPFDLRAPVTPPITDHATEGCLMDASLNDILDLSILRIDLGSGDLSSTYAQKGFWRFALMDENMAFGVRHLIDHVSVQTPIVRDIQAYADKIAATHEHESEISAEPIEMERPVEFDDYVAECTPQFILRNIPKIERYYDLDRALPFMLDDMPIVEARAQIDEIKNAKLDPPDFGDHDNIEFLNDFRAFLEEIFVLCPWDQISRKAPDEDSPWHLKNSTTKLAHHLLESRNTFFVFGTRGMTTMQLGDYQPEKEKKQDQQRPSGIGMPTFGPA